MQLESMYQDIILDHYRRPHNKGLREPYDTQVHHVNPLCGDEVTLRVALKDAGGEPAVADVSYDALGCSISQASASVMTEAVIGKSVRDAMDIILDGFDALLKSYRPGKTEAEIMAPAVERFFARGAGPRMMNIVLSGTGGEAEAHFKVPSLRNVDADDLLLYSLEVTGEAGYWVEFSRALIQGQPSTRTRKMSDVYPEAMEAARLKMHDGVLACDVHKAAADVFERAGFALGHLTGHSIGLTMIEHPAIGATTRIELRENMVCSFHPQVVDQDGQVCLYTQDTYRIGKKEGQCLASVPWKFYSGAEVSKRA